MGLFDACSYQWGVTGDAMGSQYGGVLTACQQEHGQGNHEAVKICMLDGCGTLFENDPSLAELHDGCMWFVNWYHLADNPRLDYREVPCPEALINVTGMDRTGFNDLQTCDANGSDLGGTDDGGQSCDCSWTSNGTDCGTDDGSVCWQACCGS